VGKFIDRTGLRYGRLTVAGVDPAASSAAKGARLRWLCTCDCGGTSSVTGHALQRGDTTSCGCVRKELKGLLNRSHGMSRTPTYRSWQAAKDRCYVPTNEKFPEYGGRGIGMCDAWRENFEAFLSDMGERPKGKTIDRMDTNGHYEPGNCRWATPREQYLNRRRTRLHEWAGGMRTVKEIAEIEGLPRPSLNKAFIRLRDMSKAVCHVHSRVGRSGIRNIHPDMP
jgi:hypothetical protein